MFLCVCLRSSSCSFPLLCCVVRSEKPMWSSVMSVLFHCVVSVWCLPTLTSSPSVASPQHPPLQSRLKTAQPIKHSPQTFSWVQKPQRAWFHPRSLVSRRGWWKSLYKGVCFNQGSLFGCLCGSEGQTRRGSMKSTFCSTTRAQRNYSKSGKVDKCVN